MASNIKNNHRFFILEMSLKTHYKNENHLTVLKGIDHSFAFLYSPNRL